MQSWVLTRLDHETRPRHALADNDRLSLMTPQVTPDSYRAFLTRVYGFESLVEAAIQMTPGVCEVIDLRGRSHLKLLASDLVALGVVSLDGLPRCRSVVPFHSADDALGWAYVIERNMQLHGILRRHLEQRLPEHMARAGAYLAGNERAVGTRMRELGAALDGIARSPERLDRIILAAHAAFRCQSRWFAQAVPPHAQVA